MSSSNATGVSGGPPDESGREVRVCGEPEELGRQAAGCFIESASAALSLRDRFSAALSGGSTPRILYRYLSDPSFSDRLPWKKVHLFWGDERAVPPGHPDSNYRMAYETLISKVPIPPENVHRMQGERSDLAAAAKEYEESLRRFFNLSGDRPPSFDLILLGIGTDGHTASLFPGSPALEEKERWVVAVEVEKLHSHRLTLTLPVLNHARELLFLAAGREKAAVIKALLAGPGGTGLPAKQVRPVEGKRIFLLDREAAALLDSLPETFR